MAKRSSRRIQVGAIIAPAGPLRAAWLRCFFSSAEEQGVDANVCINDPMLVCDPIAFHELNTLCMQGWIDFALLSPSSTFAGSEPQDVPSRDPRALELERLVRDFAWTPTARPGIAERGSVQFSATLREGPIYDPSAHGWGLG